METMASQPNVCIQTELSGLKLLRRGKVRDVYEYQDKILLVATDRISAFDVVLPTPIPYKGAVLTQLSQFWFDMMRDIVPNHLISSNVDKFPEELKRFSEILRLRSMLSVKAEMFPVECVARGYLAGSGWKEYRRAVLCAETGCRQACRSVIACRSPFFLRPPRRRKGTI
jgi:phosphoribosylaminoimidazole-succinocarboxamide synthase